MTVPGREELLGIDRAHIGLGDSVMPAELVFIQETPGIAQGEGQTGENRGQHPPAAKFSRHWSAVEAAQAEFRQF